MFPCCNWQKGLGRGKFVPFLPKKPFFLTVWGGDVAQKQGFQKKKSNQIEDIFCLTRVFQEEPIKVGLASWSVV